MTTPDPRRVLELVFRDGTDLFFTDATWSFSAQAQTLQIFDHGWLHTYPMDVVKSFSMPYTPPAPLPPPTA
jgi:hypothetical protein